MVKINLDRDKYIFTTKNVLDRFNIDEKVVITNGQDLKFYFKEGEPYLLVNQIGGLEEYAFESRESMVSFVQKFGFNSTLMTSLSNETLVIVANEILQQFSGTLNLVIDKNLNQILTVNSMSADLVSWRKIIETIDEVFSPLEEKTLYLTTHTGLGISIIMNDENADLDVIRIEPQTPSSISVYRGPIIGNVPLKGYDEDEIMEFLKEKLQVITGVDDSIWQNHSVV